MTKNILIPFVYLLLYLVTHTTQTILQPTSVFYSRILFCKSELCTLGHVNPGGSQSFACTTAVLQENIIRRGIALSEVSKTGFQYFSFNASVVAGGTTTSSFTITIQMNMPSGGCKLSYFLLVIKAQTTVKMIDLVSWNWGPGTTVDTEQNLNRTISQALSLTSLTVFTSDAGLTFKPLITSFHMTPVKNWDGSYASGTDTQFILSASSSSNSINLTLDVFDETRISFIRGIILIYNGAAITAEATAKAWDMQFKEVAFNDPNSYDFATDFLAYGPSYNGKCLLGYNKIFMEGYHTFDFNFGSTALGNYSIMNFNTTLSPTKQYGIIFCFGNNSIICGEGEVWIDSLTTLCYLPIKCPLPVFALWTQVNVCPICTQLICTNCTVTNRSNCITCGPFSTLTSGVCICDAGYWPLMTAISTSTQGMWNNVANSQTQCRYNCTAQIPNCVFDKCTNSTFCTQCMNGFALKLINATDQSCVACTVAIPNCVTCSSPTVCTLCDPLYFIMDWNKQCKLCGAQIPGCLTCQPWWPCLTCADGWTLQWGGCVCNPVTSNLTYCQTCSNPTTCTACISNLYFLKTTDNKCYSCSTFDPNCLQCSAQNVCTLCATTYGIETYTNGTTLCVPCSTMTNCLECLVSTACTVCATTFYPNSSALCELCSTPLLGCSTCLVATICLTCQDGWLLTSPTCTCNPVTSNLTNCLTCSSPLVCTACVNNTFYVAPADTKCYLCTNFDPNCVQCSAENVCTLCATTYGVQTYPNLTTLCVLCSSKITDCVECLVSTACTLCGPNHYILGTGCQLCNIPMPGCLTCTDGTTCTSCDPAGWTLTSNQCVCTPSTTSLQYCQTCFNTTNCTTCISNQYYLYTPDALCYPCSTFDTNCFQCSTFEMCTLCSTLAWGVKIQLNGTKLCAQCSVQIANCLECLVSTTCTLCDTNYYITGAGDCQLCSVPVLGCLTCTPTPLGAACNTCDVGWTHVIFTCVCDPVASNLANCQTCADPTICTRCVSTQFYIETTDSHCYPCTTFDPNCVTCGSLNRCSMCATTYGIQTNSDGTTLCKLCNITLSNCTECLVISACTNCDLGFGLNLAQTCSTCGSMIRGCVECETSLACLVCQSDSFLILGKCRFCWQIFHCTACVSDAVSMGCVSCQTGYYLTPDPVSGVMYCRICKDLTSYCQTCNSSQCLTCQYPYLLGSDNTCSVCSPGFQYNNGFCTNITGCQNIVLDAQGKQLCIACVQSLHFIMDTKNNKCICAVGFKQQYDPNIALLPRCVPICGDGLIMPQYQSCDDNNTIANDGCSSTCQIQTDFDCGVKQPSVCQLHVDIGSIEFSHISRVLGQNQGIMVFKIYPKHQGLTKMKWDQLVKFNFSSTSVDPSKISFSYQPLTGQLMVTVPYNQQLQASHLQSFFTLDPKYIVSQPSSFLLTHSLRGVNAPLIFQQQAQLATQKNINLITLLLTILLLLQFYAGSYSHKMIGLQTIQLIQSIYFVRMVAASSSTSLMNSINSIQYSAGGYHNEEIFFGDTTDVQLNLYSSTGQQFLMIDLKRYFLLNANLSLFPIIIAIAIFIVSLARKYRARSQYVQTKQQQLKDRYTAFRRSSQWVYDHFVFPYIMMFSLISYFQTILLLSSPPSSGDHYSNIENPSFAVHMIITLSTIAIYCYELFSSFQAYSRYSMTQSQRQQVPKSMVQKLQHDENNVDRANYHPAYIFCYLLYYFVLSLCMVGTVVLPQFTYALQVNMGLAFVYFIAIVFWKPYAQVVNVHNHFLKFYYGTFVVFLAFCYIFARMGSLGSGTYIAIMYLVTVLIGCVMAGGFIRLYIQFRFRKALQLDSKLISDIQIKQTNTKKKPVVQNGVTLTKKQALVMNNQYTFQNQLKEYEKHLMAPSSIMNANLVKNLSVTNDSSKKDYIMNRIRKDLHKRKENILLQTIAHQGYTNEMRKINERPDDNQKDGEQESLATGDNNTSNLADQILGKSMLGDSLLDKKDVGLEKSAKGMREDIKIRLRKEWALMDYQ